MRRMPSSVGTISSCARRPGVAASSKPSPTSTPLIAWMPISAPASRESRRRSQWTCEPRPGRQPVHDDLDDAAEGVAVLVGLVDRGDHRLAGVGVEAAHRVVVEPGHVVGAGDRRRPARARRRARRRGRRSGRPTACSRKCAATATQRDAGRGLPGGGALEDRPGLVEVVLLHADQVGVAGPRPGQRGVAGQGVELDRGRPGRPTSPSPTWATRCCRSRSRPGRPGSRRGGRRRGA